MRISARRQWSLMWRGGGGGSAVLLAQGGLLAQEQIPTPDVDWSALAPNLILMLGGVLLLTVVSILRGRLPTWFHAVWTISAASAAGPRR